MGNGSPVRSRKTLGGLTGEKTVALSADEYRPFKISKITQLTESSKSFIVDLPNKNDETGLLPNSFIMIKGPNNSRGKVLFAGFSSKDVTGHFELIIKLTENGIVSQHLHGLKVGDWLDIKGPLLNLPEKANTKKKNIGMICSGTDLAPVLQVLKKVLKHSKELNTIHLLCANDTEQDVMINYKTLNDLSFQHNKLQVTYIVSEPSEDWRGQRGLIGQELLSDTMPWPGNDSFIYVHGPSTFMYEICGMKSSSGGGDSNKQGVLRGMLKDMGYSEDNVFKL